MTLDANILIAYLAGDAAVTEAVINWRREGRVLFLSPVAETEVLSFSGWSDQELYAAEKFLEENFSPVPFDRALARIAAEIRRNTKIKLPEAAIAATAISTHSQLVTRNMRDFKRIAGPEIITL